MINLKITASPLLVFPGRLNEFTNQGKRRSADYILKIRCCGKLLVTPFIFLI
jgi:hypothetical protein